MREGRWIDTFLTYEEIEIINLMRKGFEVEIYPPNKKKKPDAATSGIKEFHLHMHYTTPEEEK